MSVSGPTFSALPDAPSLATGGLASADLEAAIVRIARRLDNIDAQSFLSEYAFAMCEEMSADFFMVGRLNPYSNIMRTLRFIADGELADGFIYSLDGTPCANTITGGVCIHPDNVARDYPHDKELHDLGINSYAGASLEGATGTKLGVLVAMWRTPLHNVEFVKGLLESSRRRVSSVIETVETVQRYSWAITHAFGGVWDWDLRTGGTVISEELRWVIGAQKRGQGPYDLTQIENAIHPEDRGRHVEALKRHLNEGVPYDLRLRLRDNSGVYRWHLSRGAAIRDANGKPERMIGGFCDVHDMVVSLEKAPRN